MLSDPTWPQATVFASIVLEHGRLHPEEEIVDLLPAREADVAAWRSGGGWHDGDGAPSHPAATDRPWIALVRIPTLPRARPA